jgi:hypothetical protein
MGQVPVQGDINKFVFRPERVAIGAVYHYLKSNIDGSHPLHVAIYIAARDRVESFKYQKERQTAWLVIANLDWRNFSAKHLQSWQLLPDGRRQPVAELTFGDADSSAEVVLSGREGDRTRVAIEHLPWHVYNFDFASLNAAFPHMRDPEGRFSIGIADPTFQPKGPVFQYRGQVEVAYVAEEMRNGVRCRTYRLRGKGLDSRGGFIWANKEHGHFEDVEIDLPDDPAWRNFKFRLERAERMRPEEWEAFIKRHGEPSGRKPTTPARN